MRYPFGDFAFFRIKGPHPGHILDLTSSKAGKKVFMNFRTEPIDSRMRPEKINQSYISIIFSETGDRFEKH